MIRRFLRTLLAASFVLALLPVFADEDISPVGPEAGKELAAQLRSMRPEQDQSWKGVLKIYHRNQKEILIPISGETKVTDTNWTATYVVKGTDSVPAEQLKIIFSTNAVPQYFYARAAATGQPAGELKPVANADANISLAGSDFWLSDLGFEFFYYPDQVRKPGHVHRSRSCYLLDCINPILKPGGYSKVELWIDKESGQPLDAEAYGIDKKHLKDFELGSVEKVNGHYHVKELKMSNDQTHSRTELEFDLSGGK